MTALRLGQPDRVPYFDMNFGEESILNIGKHFTSDLPEPKYIVDCTPDEILRLYEVQFKFTRELDLDAINTIFFTNRVRIPGEKDVLKDRYGIIYRLTKHGEPFPIGGPIKDPNDLKKLQLITPGHSDFSLLQYIKRQLPERVVSLTLPGPFRYSWSFLGAMEKLLLNYVTNPEFCLQLARIVTDFTKEVVEISIEQGAEVIILEGDLAFKDNTLMSPDHYRKFVKPYHYEICETAHKLSTPIVKHTDGNIWPILDDLIEAGFDGIHPIQPQCMEIKDVKEHSKGKTCIMGNIDCTYLLPFGTKEAVINSVKETIKKAAPGGGYVLTSSNSIHPGCKSENVIAMFEAARQYGNYPIGE